MKNLAWKTVLKKKCNKKYSVTFNIKYKNTTCKVKIPDVYEAIDDDILDKIFIDELKTAFGKKVGKKIFKQIMKDFEEL